MTPHAAITHPLHKKVAKAVQDAVGERGKVFFDPACIECGERMNLPLFVGEKSSGTRMCNVDMLITVNDEVRIVIEIDESSIRPTQIFGKFLQAAVSDSFIRGGRNGTRYPIGPRLLFLQVLDGSRLHPEKSKKPQQAEVIAARISDFVSHRPGLDYQVRYWRGTVECRCLDQVADLVRKALS